MRINLLRRLRLKVSILLGLPVFLLLLFGIPVTAQLQEMPPGLPPATEQKKARFPPVAAFTKAVITYTLLPGINNTWGYDILVDKRMMIHQPTLPGLPGNQGFKTRAAATSVARLVIAKMKKGEMPPSVSIEEMKKLKAI